MDFSSFLDTTKQKTINDIKGLLTKEQNLPQSFHSSFTSFFPLWVLCYQELSQDDILIVCPTDEHAYLFAKDFSIFGKEVPVFPSWGAAIGTEMSEFAPIRSERAEVLHTLANKQHSIVLCSTRSFLQIIPHKEDLSQQYLDLSLKQEIDSEKIIKELVRWNYSRVGQVQSYGEFSVRGEVLDFCNSTQGRRNSGIRINFDYDSIERISRFNTETQLRTEELETVSIHPLCEYEWSEKRRSVLHKHFLEQFPELGTQAVEQIEEQIETKGYEGREYLYYPFLLEKHSHVSEYFQNKPKILCTHYEQVHREEERYWNDMQKSFLDLGRFHPIPRSARYQAMLEPFLEKTERTKIYEIPQKNLPSLKDEKSKHFASNMNYFIKYIEELCQEDTGEVLLLSSNPQQTERLSQLCTEKLNRLENFSILSADLDSGFSLQERNLHVFTEVDVLGKRLHNFHTEQTKSIFSLDQIEKGAFVVHILYGIGRFNELVRRNFHGVEKDFIHIHYADKESLYVPVEQVNMVQTYMGSAGDVRVDSLGSGTWQKRKEKVQKNIEDMSNELLELHASRSSSVGFSFQNVEWENSFVSEFEHEETIDQKTAWEEIRKDMEDAHPMERLLVGDVGFGKTELALRAAFKAVSNGKQALLLVPTTILAEQHYHTALERFRKYPVRIVMLSRFVSSSQQKGILKDLQQGKADFLISTHRGIQKDVGFSDLGLIIVDEEHRFGVKDKEKIKKIKHNIDYLSMSATPIPRTLYQSLVELKNLSSLNEAPKERKAIETHIEKFSEELIQKAIRAELARDGQVFVLHNRVQTLEEMKQLIETLVPEATVLTASGQMQSRDLEETMYQFTHAAANVLVSTTIIENGIDIPRVNTIIIDRADNYGISQLYQLRGRVGRSKELSYAYLLYPDKTLISDIALKRLTVIGEHTALGSGFQIAMRDLEVRGAGNLLGKEQSGNIFAVGYEHYMQMLDSTMKKIKGLQTEQEKEPLLDLEFNGYIPDTYISETSLKMDLYKQIVSIKSQEEYQNLLDNIESKYGRIPQEVISLFLISKIKLLCKKFYITEIRTKSSVLEIHFDRLSHLPAAKIQKLIKDNKIRRHGSLPHVLLLNSDKHSLEKTHQMLQDYFDES